LFLASDSTLWTRSVDDTASWSPVDLTGNRPHIVNAIAFDPQRRQLIALFAPLSGSDRVDAWSLAVGGKPEAGRRDDSAIADAIATSKLEFLDATPSPAVGGLAVAFQLPSAAPATLEVFDVLGRRRFVRDVGVMGAGVHELPLDGSERWSAGVYFARLRSGADVRTRRIVLLN
jgi:hypothetical protein